MRRLWRRRAGPMGSAALVARVMGMGSCTAAGPPDSLTRAPLAALLLPDLLAEHAPSRCPRPHPLPLISALMPT